jgi:hypothetical protein
MSTRRIIVLIAATAAVVSSAFGQEEKPELVTDRPDQTEAPSIVPRGGLQVETGFVFEKDLEDGVETDSWAYNSTLIKYGVNENFEFRFITEYVGETIADNENPATKIYGFSPLAIGMKLKLADEKGFWPQASLIGHVNLRTGNKEFEPEYTSGQFRFTCAHTLNENLSLSYNLGAEWNGFTPEATFIYTLSLGYAFNDKVGAFIESYSFFPEAAKADNRADAGITYKFTPMVQADISGGIGLSSNAPDYFLSTGLSFRMFR